MKVANYRDNEWGTTIGIWKVPNDTDMEGCQLYG